MITAPIIKYPKTNWVAGSEELYYSDSLVQLISGIIPVVEADLAEETALYIQQRYRIDRNGTVGSWSQFSDSGVTVGITSTVVEDIPWSFDSENVIEMLVDDSIIVEFKTVKRLSIFNEVGPIIDESPTISVNVVIVTEKDITNSVATPTGVAVRRAKDSMTMLIPEGAVDINFNGDFAGCNYYLSLTAGGGTGGYVRMNNALVTDVNESESETVTLEESNTEDTTNNLNIQTITSKVVENNYYTFALTQTVLNTLIVNGKIANVYLSDGVTLDQDITYYLVGSVQTYDKTLNQTVESSFSVEIESSFLKYRTDYLQLPERPRDDVLFSISREMMVNNNVINVVAGSVIRDIADPISLEFERFYIIQDFIFSTLSVDTLLQFDDADGDGVSDSVENSFLKRRLASALNLSSFSVLQSLIDEQFDKHASNKNLERTGAIASKGTVTFYATTRPSVDILIPEGTTVSTQEDAENLTEAREYKTVGTTVMTVSDIETFYNASTKRYEIQANIEAFIKGSSSNVPARTINTANGVNPLLKVINEVPTLYGHDEETNKELSDRIKLAEISFDSGTEGGYGATALSVPGVLSARIEKEGDPLMMRDFDETDKKHIGGKVDVYVKGDKLAQYLDQVAFKLEYPADVYGNNVGEQFDVVDAQEYRIRTRNSKVTSDSPIVVVSQVRNITRSADYDLTSIEIIGEGDTLVLTNSITNNNIGMATLDVIEVNYKYRSSNLLVLENQPVERLVSVTDSSGNTIDESKYTLVKAEDPLLNGNSSIAKDAVRFLFGEGDEIVDVVTISDEEHDMLINTPARLNFKGVDTSTIIVKHLTDDTIIYKKDVDYTIIIGSELTYTYLDLIPTGMIRHGDRVRVDYDSSENYNVTYINNSLISQVQDKVTKMKHACADAVVKQAVGNELDISFIVTRKSGVDKSLLKARIQTSVANYVSSLKMGDAFTQSSLVNTVKNVDGVKDIIMPLTRLMKRKGSFIPLDDLGYLAFERYSFNNNSGVVAYRSIKSVLSFKTTENGGDSDFFRTVYEDNRALELADNPSLVSSDSGMSYIESSGKIIVSTTDGTPPQGKYYKASYYTYYEDSDMVVEDIETSEIEYLVIDSLSLKDIEIIDEKIVKRGL